MKKTILGLIIGLAIGTAISLLAQLGPGPNSQIGRYQLAMVAAGGDSVTGPILFPYLVTDTTTGIMHRMGILKLNEFVDVRNLEEHVYMKQLEDLKWKKAVKKYEKETGNK